MNKYINYERDILFTGSPLHIKGIGYIRFFSYIEYIENIGDLSVLKLNVLHLYHLYRKQYEGNQEALREVELLKQEKLIDIIRSEKQLIDSYIKILTLALDENSIKDTWSDSLREEVNESIKLAEEQAKKDNKEFIQPTDSEYQEILLMKALEKIITEESYFMQVRQAMMDMQMIVEDVVNPNPEIQEGIDLKRQLDAQDGEHTTPLDIVSSIVTGTSNSYQEVCNMTVIQVNATFKRLAMFKNYDTSVAFATIPGSDIKIDSWSKTLDLYGKEKHGIKKKDFDSKFGGFF